MKQLLSTPSSGETSRRRHPSGIRLRLARALREATVGSIMTRDVVTARRDATVESVMDVLLKTGFGGLPVVDDRQRPVGVVTASDVLRALRTDQAGVQEAVGGDDHDHRLTLVERLRRLTEPGSRAVHAARSTVGDVMTPLALTVPLRTRIADAAAAMSELGVHRLLVVDERRALSGIVTSLDLTRFLAAT